MVKYLAIKDEVLKIGPDEIIEYQPLIIVFPTRFALICSLSSKARIRLYPLDIEPHRCSPGRRTTLWDHDPFIPTLKTDTCTEEGERQWSGFSRRTYSPHVR